MTESEKERGVVLDSILKPAAHITNCVKRANQMLGMIQRTITYKNKKILLLMYKSLVRPHLEYAVQVWSPHEIGHIRLIVVVCHDQVCHKVSQGSCCRGS